MAAHVNDISAGGGYVVGGPPLPLDACGTLIVDGIGFALPFTVRSRLNDALHVSFALDAETASTLRSLLQGLTWERPAA